MARPIKQITIVGGGTAGWFAALLLNAAPKVRAGRPGGPNLTLIESPSIPTVGVGEATVPGMPRSLIEGGISERDFFKACNATFKLGVMFDGWNVDRDGTPISYINPFTRPSSIDGVDIAHYFLRYGAGDLSFADLVTPALGLLVEGKGPRPLGAKPYAEAGTFAYHLDAGRFARLLRDTCTARGVEHLLDDMVGADQDEAGNISAINLKETGRHDTELVIDCTGFRGLIINQIMGAEFVDYSRYLANDRAMAVQIPHGADGTIDPVTRSTALGAGWAWRVPLYNRIGTGYVFSSAHRTDDQARAEFLAHLDPDHKDAEPRIIPMRIGRNRHAWIGNCVAMGLSGGFIEPLESTAINMIDIATRYLIDNFPSADMPEPIRARYNRQISAHYDEVRDFICLHYALGNRVDDPYWIDAREGLEVPDTLAENLEIWRHRLPTDYDLQSSLLFGHSVYHSVLLGKQSYQNGFAAADFGVGIALNEEKWSAFVARVTNRFAQIRNAAAPHRALARDIRGDAEPVFPLAQPTPTGSPFANPAAATIPMSGLGSVMPAKVQIKPPQPAAQDLDPVDEGANIL